MKVLYDIVLSAVSEEKTRGVVDQRAMAEYMCWATEEEKDVYKTKVLVLNYGLFSPFRMKAKNNRKWPEIFLDISIDNDSANKPNIRKR
jgi:hypothetical protein